MTQQKENAAAAPNVVNLDPAQLLAALGSFMASQAEANRINQRLLDIQLKKEEAEQQKNEEALIRIERDRKQLHEQMQLAIVNKSKREKACNHRDQKENSTIFPMSNFPDRQLRGTCTQCGVFIEPEHYEIDAKGRKTLVAEHPLYMEVIRRDQKLYSGFTPQTGY